MLGHSDNLDQGEIIAIMARQSDVTEEERDAEAGVGGRADVDPPRYADIGRGKEEEEGNI